MVSKPTKGSRPAGKSASAARIRVGIGGWTYAPWRSNFYPPDLVQRRELEYASRTLTAIEVNGTGYAAQKPATYARWCEQVPDGFMFSLKAPRYTTGGKQLASRGAAIDAFVGDLGVFGDRLGPILWQFDAKRSFDPDDFASFLELLPAACDGRMLRHVLEVRHPSFACREYIELARRHAHASVFTDSDEHPSFSDVTGDFVYLRLVRAQADIANGYAPKALKAWAERARIWRDGGEPTDLPRVMPAKAPAKPRDVFVYFINGAKERAPHAAMKLIATLDNTR